MSSVVEDSPARVLLVHGERRRQRLVRTLARHGLAVVVAPSVGDATEELRRQRFDVVVTETCLSDGTGFDLFHAAHQRAAELPFVFVGSDPELPARLGDARYWCRTAAPTTLLALVVELSRPFGGTPAAACRRALDRRRASRQLRSGDSRRPLTSPISSRSASSPAGLTRW